MCGALALPALLPGSLGEAAGAAALWAGMIVPIAIGLSRSRPRGLLRFRAADVVYALALGIALRLLQGVLEVATGGSGALPHAGAMTGSWWLTGVVVPVAVAPLVEEFFFRGVLLICVYTLVPRAFGPIAASVVALVVSAVAFALAHLVAGAPSGGDLLATAAVGAVCATLVLATGRIWPAVGVHAVYNATGVALAVVGSLSGGAPSLS